MFRDARQILITTDGRAATRAVSHEVPPNTFVTYTYEALHLPNGTFYTKMTRENRVIGNQ